MGKKTGAAVPEADTVEWLGLCPCGCGAFKMALLDKQGRPIAMFGMGREEWFNLMSGVMQFLNGERPEGSVCEHTAH